MASKPVSARMLPWEPTLSSASQLSSLERVRRCENSAPGSQVTLLSSGVRAPARGALQRTQGNRVRAVQRPAAARRASECAQPSAVLLALPKCALTPRALTCAPWQRRST